MPLRSPKMYSFIFGFHRFVWWPKCTPASSRSFIAIPGKLPPFLRMNYRLLNWNRLRAPASPYFLRSLTRESDVEQPVLLQLAAQLRVELDERARNAEAHRAGLTIDAAAGDRGEDVELVAGLREQQRPPHLRAQRLGREVSCRTLDD